ncbi:class II fructose-bisphosphatase [Weizmannia coagulans]|nr:MULTISPECIES: class II fructose-bisphosphatase [Heyndrickxia]AKN52888.1 Fructose-1,6-bisphosphatase, GlpX type [Heyndrickxia coagulans]APB37291.1 fructose-bisphosphatase, class II [Heyndrickxia coagulans]ATW82058.1 fructose-bisphosphatase class II [Heyndrickxia coagulans]MBT2195456.1 class II fructose-bisphosphatase [Heyndrickxia coagulans]MBT2237706.1 class II fructose-bisphosphatase [Heyndrickxia coagulans]
MQTETTLSESICTQNLVMSFLAVSQQAAIACYPLIGRSDKMAADDAGTKAMRSRLNRINMDAVVVIGEGEMDEAPMLYINEKLGTGSGPKVDIAVDPVEGTNLMAAGKDNALSVISAATRGSLLHAPDMYMKKIAVGPQAKGCIDIDKSLTENMKNVARSLGKDIRELDVMIQERPRHQELAQEAVKAGAHVRFFSEADVTAAIATAFDHCDADIFAGIGGAPEGVVAATALKSLGGDFQGKLVPQSKEEIERCIKMGIPFPEKKLTMDDIVKTDDCFFVATGITNGMLLDGVKQTASGKLITHSIVLTGGKMKYVQFIHGQFSGDSEF